MTRRSRAQDEALRHAAVDYAKRGWYVLPLSGKLPFKNTRGVHDATCLPSVAGDLWSQRLYPGANVGIACGASGLLVLDIDPHKGGTLDALKPYLAPTLVSRTGSDGWHVLYKQPCGITPLGNSPGRLPAGIDVRGAGGYIVAPPSIHPKTRQPYRWGNSRPVADAPAALLDVLRPAENPQPFTPYPRASDSRILDGLVRSVLQAHPDPANNRGRNTALFWAGCRAVEHARAGVLDEHSARSALARAAEQVGLPQHEINLTLNSAWRKA